MKSAPQRINPKWLVRAAYAAFLIVAAWAYLHLSAQRLAQPYQVAAGSLEARNFALAGETERDLELDFSRSVSGPLKQWLPHRTDGLVQPLWPWISAWTGDASDPTKDMRRIQGGWLQAGLTLGFLVVLGFACVRRFSFPAAVLVVLLVGFQGLLPTVGQFTGAALFQILFLLTWVAGIYGLQRNSLWVYGLAGALGGFAYLTEDRVLPLLLVFAGVSTLRAVWEWLEQHWSRNGPVTTLWVPRNHLLGSLLMATMFFFIAGPRLSEAHQRFGTPFFHYQDEVRWLEDAGTARDWIAQHESARSLAAIRPEDRLSLQNYLSEHPQGVAWARLSQGMRDVLAEFGAQGGMEIGALLLILFGMAVALPLATPKAVHAGQRLHPESVPAVFFMVLSAAVYVGIAGWDAPITGTQERLLLLQPPLALGLLWGCESLRRRALRRKARGVFLASYQSLLWLMVALHSWRVIQGLQAPPSTP